MLATLIVESSLLLYVLFRYALRTPKSKIASIVLLCLAVFQLAEYNVCGRFNIDALVWSKIGFAAITLLPPLGLHLVYVLAKKKTPILVWLAYGSAAVFVYLFALSSFAFTSHQCAGNYAIFQLADKLGGWYFFYYYFWLLVTVLLAAIFRRGLKDPGNTGLLYLIAGYGFFMLPTAVVNTIKPDTMLGIPSVMCGFAVVFAIVLVFGILPEPALPKKLKH